MSQGSRGRHSGDLGPVMSDVSMYPYQVPMATRDGRYLRQGSREGSFESPGSLSASYPYSGEQREAAELCVLLSVAGKF